MDCRGILGKFLFKLIFSFNHLSSFSASLFHKPLSNCSWNGAQKNTLYLTLHYFKCLSFLYIHLGACSSRCYIDHDVIWHFLSNKTDTHLNHYYQGQWKHSFSNFQQLEYSNNCNTAENVSKEVAVAEQYERHHLLVVKLGLTRSTPLPPPKKKPTGISSIQCLKQNLPQKKSFNLSTQIRETMKNYIF